MSEIEFKEYKYWKNKDQKPENLVIMLHGLGADGEDLISLAHYFAKEMPNTAFVAPNAPYENDMAPPGTPMGYQWFSLRDTSPAKLVEEVSNIAPIMYSYIEAKKQEFGLTNDKIALLGFSQGSMLSLFLAPRLKEALAAVLSYSGALIAAEDLEANKDQLTKIPVHLAHGDSDDIVPFAVFEPTKEVLENVGLDVSTTVCPGLGHGIDEKGIEDGIKFLMKHLK